MPSFEKNPFAIFIVTAAVAILTSSLTLALPSGISMADIEGRWAESRESFVLDLTKCGDKICGRRVDAGGQCGRTMLTLEVPKGPGIPENVQMSGDFDWSGTGWSGTSQAEPHWIHVNAGVGRDPNGSALRLSLIGFDRSISRRGPAVRIHLARIGQATCGPDQTS